MIAPVFAQQPWWESYDFALSDIKSKNWNLAEERLKNAMKEQPQQGKKVRAYGARFVRYLPEYYLGVVYLNQGKHQAALEQFLRVQNQSLIGPGDEEYADLNRFSKQAMAKLNPDATTPPIHTEPDSGDQIASMIDQANQALSSGSFEQARNITNQALKIHADNPKAKDLLRKIDVAESVRDLRGAISTGDMVQAEKISQKLASLDPQNAELGKFRALQKTTMEDKTAQQFNQSLNQAEQELNAKNYARARVLANQALNIPGQNTDKARTLVQNIDLAEAVEGLPIAVAKRDLVAAERWAKQVERIDPSNKVLLMYRQKKNEQSVDQKVEEQYASLLLQSNRELRLKNFAKAEGLAKKALGLPGVDVKDAKDTLQKIQIAQYVVSLESSLQKKDWKSVPAFAEKLRALDPDNVELKKIPALVDEIAAITDFYAGRYPVSLEKLQKLLKNDNGSARVHFYLGCNIVALALMQTKFEEGIRQKNQFLKKAHEEFVEARRLSPNLKIDKKFISPRILQIYQEASSSR